MINFKRLLTNKKIIFAIITLSIVVSNIIHIYKFNYKYTTEEKYTIKEVAVVEKIKETEEKISYKVKYNKDTFILNIYESKYNKNKKQSIEQHSRYKYGDVLNVKGKIVIPELLGNPGEFNYKRYLNSVGICGTISTYEVEKKAENTKGLGHVLHALREYEGRLIDKAIENKENSSMLKSFIYGDKKDLSEDVKNTFTEIGVSHMLVASGSNIATIILIIKIITKKLKLSNKTINIILLITIFLFMALCNFEYSITRAGIVGILNVLLNLFNIKMRTYNKVFVSLGVLYILNPICIYNVGLQLSFFATLSIVFLNSKIYSRISYFLSKRLKEKTFKILKPVILSFCITLSASIGTFPIQINNFNSYSIITFLSNILLGVFTGIIRNVGILGIVLSVLPNISIILFKTLEIFVKITKILGEFLQNISYIIYFKSIPMYIVFLYYLLLLVIILKDNLVIKKFSLSIKVTHILNKAKQYIIYIILLLLIVINIYSNLFQDYLMFFNVKQGDMAYLNKQGASILIDAGSETKNLASNVFLNFCKKENIQKVDLLIISHFHDDHVNGILEIVENLIVGKVIFPIPRENNENYIKIRKKLIEKNIPFEIVEKGDKLCIKDIQITILSPGKENIQDEDIQNSNSLVCKIETEDFSCLFTGDATKNTEQYILKQKENIKADILKVGHHGSKTSTSSNFISRVLPEIAVISSFKEKYGHPNEETLKLLNLNFIDTYITEEKGAIKLIF